MRRRSFIRHALSVALALVSASIGVAQVPAIEWARCYGGTQAENGECIQQTSDGGYVVAGRAGSTDGDVTSRWGGDDYWVVKLDNTGAIQWQNTYGGDGSEWAYAVVQTSDGGYAVAGSSNSTNGDVSGHHGTTATSDIWFVKLTSTGAIQWSKSLGGTGDDRAYSMHQTTDGGYIIAGVSNSTDGDLSSNQGGFDYWIVKLDGSGNIAWQKSYGGSKDDYAMDIQQTSEGGYIVAGYTLSSNGDVTGFHGGTFVGDYWVLKLDNTGAVTWKKCYGGSVDDAAFGVCEAPGGGYVITGYSWSTDFDRTVSKGGYDCWTLKVDNSGNIVWEKSYGGPSLDQCQRVVPAPDGGYVMTGVTFSSGGDVTDHHAQQDFWVVKIGSDGGLQWQKCLGGTDGELANGIQVTSDGLYVVAGYTQSTDGDVAGLHGTGNTDFWVVKLGYAPNINSIKSVDAGSLICDTTATVTIQVHNVGNQTLNVTGYSFVGNNSGELRLISPASFPVSIAPGDSLPFVVKRTTSVVGAKSDSLSLTNNDPVVGHSPWYVAVKARKERIAASIPALTIVDSVHAGTAKDTTALFTTTGTLTDTIRTVVQISGVPWISYTLPALPLAVKPTAPANTALLQFHIAAPRDTGWFAAQFRVHVEPCGIDTVVTIRVYLVSGILNLAASKDIGGILCESERCDSFVVHNNGNGKLTISGAALAGNDPQQFNRLLPKPVLTIAPRDSLKMFLCFQPKPGATGVKSTIVWLTSDDSISTANPQGISLSAKKDSAAMALAPTTIDLGNVCVGQAFCGQIQVNATGTVADTLRAITFVSGDNTIAVTAPQTPAVVASGASGTITVCFTPLNSGPARATFSVLSQPCGRTGTFTVTARGVQSNLVALDQVVDFGTALVGGTKYGSARLTVQDVVPITVSNLGIVPAGTPFVVDSVSPSNFFPLPHTMQPRDTVIVYFHYTPTKEGSDLAQLQIALHSWCGTTPAIALTGSGVSGSLLLARTQVYFGAFICNQPTQRDTVAATNAGTLPLIVHDSIFGPNAADYALVGPSTFTIAPGATQSIIVDCTPAAFGTSTATLLVTTNDPTGHPLQVALSARRDSIGHTVTGVVRDTYDFGTMLPSATKNGTITLVNTSTVRTAFNLRTDDPTLFTTAQPWLSLASSGAQQPVSLQFTGRPAIGRYDGTLVITDTCGTADSVFLVARVDTVPSQGNVEIDIAAVADTTVCPNTALTRQVVVRNRSITTQVLVRSGLAPLFTAIPDTLVLGAGDSGVVTVTFAGAPTPGAYTASYNLTDSRGVPHVLSATVRVDSFALSVSAITDTTICAGDSVVRRVTIRNAAAAAQTVQLTGGGPGFSSGSNPFVLQPGAAVTVDILFRASATAGAYTATYGIADGCGNAHSFTIVVHVDAPHVTMRSIFDTTVCPFTTVNIPLVIRNADDVSRSVTVSATGWTLSRQALVVVAGSADSTLVTFPGGDTGTYTCTVRVTDECGGTRDAVMTVNVRSGIPLQLSLQADPVSTIIGTQRRVSVVASAIPPGAFAFTVGNETSALWLDSVSSACDISVIRSANSATVQVAGCGLSVADTVATLYYRTLVGSTLSPRVTLRNVSTNMPCVTASGAGDVVLALLPPGCELGTVAVHPFSTGITTIYPNPATGMTTISYATVEETVVTIAVRDALGRTAQTLVHAMQKPGKYSTTFDTGLLATGAYSLAMQVGGFVEERRVMVVR